MKIKDLPRSTSADELPPLVFTSINDSPDNPRFGLGYKQLSDPIARVPLAARLPEVIRAGDTMTLYWDGANVQQYQLDPSAIEAGWLSFGVLPISIEPPQGEVYYTHFDPVADVTLRSATRTIAVNRRVPGGLDPDIETAINEGLDPCTVSPNPVTDASVPVTVSVPQWLFQEVGDELTVMWNNIRVDHPKLTTTGPQDVIIPRDVLEAGGSSDHLKVDYEIRDIVDNYSLVSPATDVEVEIDPDALSSPRVLEADRVTRVLDLVALGDNDAHVAIPVYIGNRNGYEVTLTWVGKTPTADIILNLPPQRVEDPDFDHAEFAILNAHMKLIAGGSAVTRFSLKQDGDNDTKRSRTTTITITGLPVQLAKPVVDEANGTDVIDLADVIGPQVTVSIAAYTGQSVGDKVLLTWSGTPTQGAPVNYTDEYLIQFGGELLPVTFRVARANIDPLGGGTLDLSYQVIFKSTGNTQDSPVMQYSVSALSEQPVSGDESFEAQALGPLPLNRPLPFAHNLTITITGAAGTSTVTPNIPQFGDVALYCGASSKIKFEFGGTITQLFLSHALTLSALNRLEFFNAGGALVHAHNFSRIPVGSTVGNENVQLPSPCTYCELAVDTNGTMIDNLIWM